MWKNIIIHPEKCTGCRLCELYCSFHHFKVNNPSRSRIHVIRSEPYIDSPILCIQCGLCINVCPVGAIVRNKKNGAINVLNDKCIGCAQCVFVCPYGAATIDPITKKALICDFCNGEPECVKNCPEKVLEYVDATKAVYYKNLIVSKLLKKESIPLEPYPK
jgi:Fe-S-cluster-containing hydrogenase component 2